MHFTQTRIATIDSYVVLFIMVMYLFMFRYSQMRWRRDGFARSLIPLGLSGLFMGISWATKWVGIYGSAGLVVIFFWTLWKNVRGELRLLKGLRKARRVRLTRRARRAGNRAMAAEAVALSWRGDGKTQSLAVRFGAPVPRRKEAGRAANVCAPQPLGVASFVCLWGGHAVGACLLRGHRAGRFRDAGALHVADGARAAAAVALLGRGG